MRHSESLRPLHRHYLLRISPGPAVEVIMIGMLLGQSRGSEDVAWPKPCLIDTPWTLP